MQASRGRLSQAGWPREACASNSVKGKIELKEPERQTDDTKQTDSTQEGGVGDVETAGETTAASAISGPPDTKPVGADTLAKVGGASEPADDAQ